MSKFTITYSNTIPRGEGKFGSFEKLEITREFDDKDISPVAAQLLCKAFVHSGLGIHQQSDAEVETAFRAMRHVDEDRSKEMVTQDRVRQIPGMVSVGGSEWRESQLRIWLIDCGFDIDEVLAAQARSAKEGS